MNLAISVSRQVPRLWTVQLQRKVEKLEAPCRREFSRMAQRCISGRKCGETCCPKISRQSRKLRRLGNRKQWRKLAKQSPKVFSIVRQRYGRSPTDQMKDLNVNTTMWDIFMFVTFRAAILGMITWKICDLPRINPWNFWDRYFKWLSAWSRIKQKFLEWPRVNRKQGVDQLIELDHVPTNKTFLQGKSQLYIFEDNEAVIKMIVKGRSPTMRHVSRTYRVALDWLFVRIDLDPKIQIKHVDTKKLQVDGEDVLSPAMRASPDGWLNHCDRAPVWLFEALPNSQAPVPHQNICDLVWNRGESILQHGQRVCPKSRRYTPI